MNEHACMNADELIVGHSCLFVDAWTLKSVTHKCLLKVDEWLSLYWNNLIIFFSLILDSSTELSKLIL